jgi:hypothetical protein
MAGRAGIARSLTQNMNTLRNRIAEALPDLDRPLHEPFRGLVIADHARQAESLRLFGQLPAFLTRQRA